MKFHHIDIDINVKVSRFVKFFVLSDLFLFAGWGLVAPIFAIFIIERVEGATLITIGVAASIYWIIKSLIQIPVANFLDKTEGEQDDFYVLVVALILAGVNAFALILITRVWHLFAVQIIQALAFGLYIPAWRGMFSRHLDQKHISLDWSLDSTVVGLASGVTGVTGGVLAQWLGFDLVFVLVGIFSFASALVIIAAPDLVFPKKQENKEVVVEDHKYRAPFK